MEITINLMLTEQFLCCVVKIILHSPCAPRIDKIENNVSLFGVKIEEEIRQSIFAEPSSMGVSPGIRTIFCLWFKEMFDVCSWEGNFCL